MRKIGGGKNKKELREGNEVKNISGLKRVKINTTA